jgi:electron transfer flavoprotein alpha subunit
MSNTILIYIDQFKGAALPASWEAIGAGRILAEKLGDSLAALAIGSGAKQLASQAFQFGVDTAYFAEEASLVDYRPEPYTAVITELAKELAPEVLLFPTTIRSRELAAMSSIDLGSGVLPDVTAFEIQDCKVLVTRPVYAGKLLAKAVCQARPQIITIRGRTFPQPTPDPSHTGEPVQVAAVLPESQIATKVVGYSQAEAGVSLADAAVIISGGRGLANNPKLTPPAGLDEKAAEIWRAQQGFKMLEELAAVLGGAIGASRAAVDAGYISYDHQVGQTGKVVTPDLYIACGISGAIQHQAGMRSSKVIVALNKDADAPIFKLARFGVAGDVFTIVPALTEAFRKKLGK